MLRDLKQALDALGWVAAPCAPFSDKGMVFWSLDARSQSVLSIGCGNGEKDQRIVKRRNPRQYLVGLDIFEPYLQACQKRGVHDSLVLADARRLPFGDSSFDVILAAEVIEHLEKNHARELLAEMERVARKQIIVTCPVGHVDQEMYDDNPFQLHRSAFSPLEFRQLGYKVHGVGLRWAWFGGDASLAQSLLAGLVSLLPVAYSAPELGGAMVCVKRLDVE